MRILLALCALLIGMSVADARPRPRASNGVCGPANGGSFSIAPTAGLCTTGTASWTGVYTWDCLGVNGGTAAHCFWQLTQPSTANTTGGAALPAGWTLKRSDRFGTDGNVADMATLHSLYCEGQYYNIAAGCLVKLPNTVINSEQGIYSHFEDVIAFSADHLTIQGRGHPDKTITTGMLVSKATARSFCYEAKLKVPAMRGSWGAFWAYSATPGDGSELDVEWPMNSATAASVAYFFNHPAATSVVISDPNFSADWMWYHAPGYDSTTAPHVYTTCYDDSGPGRITRYLDGALMYSATWKWNQSLGGTGHGPDSIMTLSLAVGGSWAGDVAVPSAYVGDLDVYSIEYYGL